MTWSQTNLDTKIGKRKHTKHTYYQLKWKYLRKEEDLTENAIEEQEIHYLRNKEKKSGKQRRHSVQQLFARVV